jgi:hypothetical protein
VLLAIGLVTACTLAFQVVLTRMFSAVMAYHFSFLAISLALLGTGGGALLIYVRPAWFDRAPLDTVLARWCSVFSALLVVIPFVLVRLDFGRGDLLDPQFATTLAAACVLAALPSFAAGVVVALAIRGYTTWVGRVYAWDLVGGGLGALLVVPALRFPAQTLVVVLGIAAAVAAALFGWSSMAARTTGATLAGVGAALVTLAAFTSVLFLPPRYPLASDAERVSDLWTPLSRVQGYVLPHNDAFAVLFYDRVYTPVPIVHTGAVPDWRALGTGPQSIGYELTGPGRALIIGGGGGRDIDNALASGQRSVDVIELNQGIRRVVDHDLGRASGSPYTRSRVSTTIGDGRSVLAARDTRYDQVHIGFTDTLSANSAQGYALTENNLYTVEAFENYLDHLAPRGVLNVSRQLKLVGDEALRATVLTLAALERHGVKDATRNVVVILGRDVLGEKYGTILARLEPYTEAELATIRSLANERGRGLAFAPGGPYVAEWKQLHDAPSWRSFCASYRLNVCPPTDDKPFFFNMKRLGQLGERPTGYAYGTDPYDMLMLILGILTVLGVIAFLLPLPLATSASRPRLSGLVFFAAIGLGFLLFEIVLIQRFVLFLGFPTYALSVVLFALLVFSGCGSYLSTRFAPTRRVLTTALGLIALLVGVSAYGLQPLLRELIDAPFTARVVLTIAIVAPLGLLLGMAMPIGLRRFQGLYPDSVPYAWGVNGVASVLASVLGIAIAINRGFAVASMVACACYVVAMLHAAVGRWPVGASGSAGASTEFVVSTTASPSGSGSA